MINHNVMWQKGFSLIELLIGIVVGLIAVAAIVSAFTNIVLSNADYLKMIRLNQELNSLITLMTRDLKRAGYSGAATGVTSANPFMTTANLTFGDAVDANTFRQITFGYDTDDDGVVDTAPAERFGYRYDSANLSVDGLKNTAWTTLSDEEAIEITGLTFVENNLSLTDASTEEIRYIIITLSGRLAYDHSVSRTLTEQVRVRNDRP